MTRTLFRSSAIDAVDGRTIYGVAVPYDDDEDDDDDDE